ncbi:TPA: CD15/CS22/SEF14 family fimbrial major subunit [Escherichia coli]|nr:CD15/CS22/SEF14 family fimbrial major subunit [Escherichia coli]
MRKFSILAAIVTVFSATTANASTLAGNSASVEASVDVISPTVLSASWQKVPALQPGHNYSQTKVGSLTVSGVGNNFGFVAYGNGNTEWDNGYTKFKFAHDDGSFINVRLFESDYPGVVHGAGTSIGTGPATFIPAKYSTVDFKLDGSQELKAGTYSTTISVSAYND